MNPTVVDHERSWSREESSNPIITVQGALRRPSTGDEIEQRKQRLSSSEQERHSFVMAPPDGLSSAEADDRLKKFGRNELEDKKKSKLSIQLMLIMIRKNNNNAYGNSRKHMNNTSADINKKNYTNQTSFFPVF